MWNFAGRQNDIQGYGEPEHGNWITGISFIDNMLYGDQDLLPDELKANKGHNASIVYHIARSNRSFLAGMAWKTWYTTVLGRILLVLMTGLAIVIYLNQTPSQPRERDYAYAASFYAYAIWCGLGVLALYDWARNSRLHQYYQPLSSHLFVCLFLSRWHHRHGMTTIVQVDILAVTLVRTILIHYSRRVILLSLRNGDNDTFPLWYNQEVEEYVQIHVFVTFLICRQTGTSIKCAVQHTKSPSVPISWPRLIM